MSLSSRKAEITMKITDCYIKLGSPQKAIRELEKIIQTFPNFESARIKLGKIYNDKNQLHLARSQWEEVLDLNPNNKRAKSLLKELNNSNQIELS